MGSFAINGAGNGSDNYYGKGNSVTTKQNIPNQNTIFGETRPQNTKHEFEITPKQFSIIDEQTINELMHHNKLNDKEVSPEQELNQLKETLLENSKITVRNDPKLGTCYNCRGFETNMGGKKGAIDLAAQSLKDLVFGKKQYLELSQKGPQELTPEEKLEVLAYEAILKSMQLTIDADGNIVNAENCEYNI